jgi:hypothetical protein
VFEMRKSVVFIDETTRILEGNRLRPRSRLISFFAGLDVFQQL